MPSPLLTHVVLISFHAEVSQAEREKTRAEIRRLGEVCGGRDAGILYWSADWNQDQRKNFQLMAMAVFADKDALRNYRKHPRHVAFAAGLSGIADWIVGDLVVDTAVFPHGLQPAGAPGSVKR